jgi:nitrite reductase (NO-forming)
VSISTDPPEPGQSPADPPASRPASPPADPPETAPADPPANPPPNRPAERPPNRPAARILSLARPFLPVVSVAVTLGLLVGLVMVGLFRDDDSAAAPAAGSAAADAAPAADNGDAAPVSFDIELGDLYIKPSSIDVPAGAKVVLHVTNKGAQDHTLALEGADEPLIHPGGTATRTWGGFTESTQAWCTVPGHKDAGMVLGINVKGSAAASSTSGGTAAPAAAGDDATIDANGKPSAGWQAWDPTLKPADPAKVHQAHFTVKEQKNEVGPGATQLQWTYDGHAPGPILRGKVGDTFKVTLTNGGTMSHSIDFHASKVDPTVQMRLLKPGESLVYEFTAHYAGIFTYHCGASPMIQHMSNGMFGAVVIDPPGLPKVDKELVLVQSELDLGPQGGIADLKKMMAGQNDAVVFNGYYNQYAFSPIHVDKGDRVRIWVDDAAVNEPLAFHIVGMIFDTAWKEGNYLLRPDGPTKGGSQTLDLSVTQGGFVEFTADTAGTYTIVNHIMKDLSRGAVGTLVVGDGGGAAAH